MLSWILALAAGLAAAAVQYGRSAASRGVLPLALLRTVVVTLVVALLLGAPAGRGERLTPDVALDASQSWFRAADSVSWTAAMDSAAAAGGALRRFGDSLRADVTRSAPLDHASGFRSVVDAATGSGRPVVIITDGELDEPELLSGLPRGSRALVIAKREGADAAVSALDAPHALLAGDTVAARVTVIAGASGAPAGRVELRIDDQLLESATLAPLDAFAERVIELRGIAGGAERAAVLRALVTVAGDREPRNDTLGVGVDITSAPAAVFVSTTPDYDAREAVAALRGVTSLPTRAFYRVAPGMWRSDAGLARVEEREVRAAAAGAPMVVLHGDTAVFGAPRTATRGALLLFAPPASDDGEWFATSAPLSPLAPAIGGIPFDSLPPLSVASLLPRGEWQGLVARRGGMSDDRRPALVGWDTPRRVAVLGAAGLWRWRFRGGIRADSYSAFFGALFDWMAAGRTDRRAAVPDGTAVRAGMPIRWRRGAPADTIITVHIAGRGAGAHRDSVTVRFTDGTTSAETAPLPVGVHDVTTEGGTSVIVVNPSLELLPRRPTLTSGAVGGEPALGDPPVLREQAWIYALIIALLCAEWLLRRRTGLR